MNYIDDDYQGDEVSVTRPVGLTVLCVLTFINSGITFIGDMAVYAMYNTLPALMEQASSMVSGSMAEAYAKAADMYTMVPRYSYLVLSCMALLSVTGAGLMMKMRKAGFHLYTLSQLVMLVMPVILSKSMHLDFMGVCITLVFIGAYGMYYKKME